MHIPDHDREAIVKWAQKNHEILQVWLYGSRARGDHSPGSDIDLAVVLAGRTKSDRDSSFIGAEWNEGPALSRRVHLETYDSNAARTGVDSDGICLFSRR